MGARVLEGNSFRFGQITQKANYMLKVGDKAPSFEAPDENGEIIRLKDFEGKKLVLYFYPKDMTPGCTVQARNLTTNLPQLNDKGYEVLGVSADSQKRHCRFIEKEKIAFKLLADEEMNVIKAYGVWGRKKFMGREYEGIHRKTFVIDESGRIERIIEKVKTKSHSEQILEAD